MTKAVILAAGRGSRMLDETADRPKCLVELAGKALLEWQLESLKAAGIDNIAVVAGYRADDLNAYAKRYRFELLTNPDWEKTNMVSTLLAARPWIDNQDTVVSYADIVYPARHIESLMGSASPIAITYDTEWEALWRLRNDDPLADAETFREVGGRLIEIGGKPRSIEEVQGQYMGLLRFREAGWRAVDAMVVSLGEKIAKTDMTSLLRLLLSNGADIGAIPVAGCWCEVDNGRDRDCYEAALKAGGWDHDWRG